MKFLLQPPTVERITWVELKIHQMSKAQLEEACTILKEQVAKI